MVKWNITFDTSMVIVQHQDVTEGEVDPTNSHTPINTELTMMHNEN